MWAICQNNEEIQVCENEAKAMKECERLAKECLGECLSACIEPMTLEEAESAAQRATEPRFLCVKEASGYSVRKVIRNAGWLSTTVELQIVEQFDCLAKQTATLPVLKPDQIVNKPSVVLIVGPSQSGKTTLLKSLLRNEERDIYICSPYMEFEEEFPSAGYSNGFNGFAIQGSDRVVVLDNAQPSKGNSLLREAVFKARQKNTSIYITAHSICDVDPVVRTNIDYLFVLSNSDILPLYDKCFWSFCSRTEFKNLLREYTAGFGALVLFRFNSAEQGHVLHWP